MLQVPFDEVQVAEPDVGDDRCVPSTFHGGEAERLLPMTPALGEGPERAQGPRQPRPGLDEQVCTGRARLPVRHLDVPPSRSCPWPGRGRWRGQGDAGRLSTAGLVVHPAQPVVAVGQERAHAQFLGQSQGLLVVRLSLPRVWRVTTHGNLAEQLSGPCPSPRILR